MKKAVFTAAALAFAAPSLPAEARPGQQQYTTMTQHDPGRFQTILNAARDALSSGEADRFRVLMNGRAVLLLIPGTTGNQKEWVKNSRLRGLEIVACKEIIDQLAKRNKGRRPPLLLNARIEPCAGSVRKLDSSGWFRVPGL